MKADLAFSLALSHTPPKLHGYPFEWMFELEGVGLDGHDRLRDRGVLMGAQLLNEHPRGCDLLASTPWGAIFLQLPRGRQDDAYGLIQQLSHWCQQPLVFAQCLHVHVRQAGALLGTVCDAKLAPIGTQIEIPFGLMRSTPPPLALQGASIKWPQLTFHVTVASLDDADIEPRHVQEGGLMLLPHAFQSPWLVHLTEQRHACQVVGHLHLDAGRIDLVHVQDVPVEVSQATLINEDVWQVQLSRKVQLDLPWPWGGCQGSSLSPLITAATRNPNPTLV